MKKILGLLAAVVLACGLAGCGSTAKGATKEMAKPIEKQNKVLVAYFSASGNTEKVAKNMATLIGADAHNIAPKEKYTSDDLNYRNDNSRSAKERDPKTRPAIGTSVTNMGQYDVILLGYPIWWGEAPRIINTFLDSYDFSGKTIVPFCTSGGSGMGASGSKLAKEYAKATWKEGGQLSPNESGSSLTDWLKKQGVNVK